MLPATSPTPLPFVANWQTICFTVCFIGENVGSKKTGWRFSLVSFGRPISGIRKWILVQSEERIGWCDVSTVSVLGLPVHAWSCRNTALVMTGKWVWLDLHGGKLLAARGPRPLSLWMRVYIGSEATMCGSLRKRDVAKDGSVRHEYDQRLKLLNTRKSWHCCAGFPFTIRSSFF